MKNIGSVMDKVNDFLDKYVLPWPVRFLTFRFVILLTISLLIPLIVYANNTPLVLGLNSYLNTMSVAVSSIVLLYATITEVRQKQIADLQEKRAQEDHTHVTEMHQLVLQTLKNQTEEILELRKIMEQLAGLNLPTTIQSEMPDLQKLHPRGEDRFQAEDVSRSWQQQIHHNELVSSIGKELKPSSETKKSQK